jgi:hypothetical protein
MVDHRRVDVSVPRDFTALQGNASHWQVVGTTSIASATATRFRVFPQRQGLTAQAAKSNGWKIDWVMQP